MPSPAQIHSTDPVQLEKPIDFESFSILLWISTHPKKLRKAFKSSEPYNCAISIAMQALKITEWPKTYLGHAVQMIVDEEDFITRMA
jgi:hypothetical protein